MATFTRPDRLGYRMPEPKSPFAMAREFSSPASPASMYTPEGRVQQLAQEHQQFPGTRPGGSGATGIRAGGIVGARQWSGVLNRQQEYLRLLDSLSGDPQGVNVQFRQPSIQGLDALRRK